MLPHLLHRDIPLPAFFLEFGMLLLIRHDSRILRPLGTRRRTIRVFCLRFVDALLAIEVNIVP
jgi:hypothetical protein